MADQEGSSLFNSCTFAFVPCITLTCQVIAELSQSIAKYGGQVCKRKRDGSLPLASITHIVSNTIEFPEYDQSLAMMIPVVKSKWITASFTKGKLAQIRPFTPDPRMIFSDVMLSCADIPDNDKDTITGATMAMGGMYSDGVTKLTTHICALTMDHPKVRMAVEKKHKGKIVLPHWFDDCFKLGKRIDEGPYLLPDPEILRMSPGRSIEPQCSPYLDGAISARPDYMQPPTDQERVLHLTIFKDKKIMLSNDLEMRDRLRQILDGLVTGSGGQLIDDAQNCDWLVCRYRDTEEYVQASQLGKTVGNMSWLFYLIQNNTWSNPLHRLLHYPEPRNGIPGFNDMRISVSNYGGEARIYLENLIKATGATFTKTMKADNTHLVTARDNSEKCDAARDWNIHMVNHLWIEESYAKSEMQSVTVPKYTHFPPRTNLGEIIGQTFFDEKKLQALHFPGGPEKPTMPPPRKRKALEMTDDAALAESASSNTAAGRQPRKEFDIMRDGDAETAAVDELPPPSKRRSTDFTTPARGRHVRSGKENETPSSVASSSRSAKDKALGKISNLAPDIALYEKEKKRGLKDGHGLWGGKRAADLIEREHLNRRRTSSPTAVDDKEPKSEKRPTKKARPTLPEVEIRVILTGFKRWVNDKHKEDADRKKLRDMGIAVVQDGQPCDYLIAPQLVRTVKFLRNLSKGAIVLSSTWVEDCLDTKQIPDPDNYILKDSENEKRFGLKLETSIRRAQKNKGHLLAGIPIYCTASIKNGPESYQAIADANGAQFMVYGPRSGSTIRVTNPEDDEGGPDPVYLLSTSTAEEKKLWKRFEDMARRGNMEPRVVASDWLLDVVMKQEVSFDEKYLAR
ncbi:BRCT domain-containing protein [Xylaria bambusicola]|uniref:BRCT domain-containing protein n=1 Tax=Xylaria bambusicola TaxID=326684 RepID=UPI00200766F3|nr:BRCT domain-containing protein [Xylaria bambusicola]KAI0514931.1 BRCT domain-containing protein [Xylaria bambusicola]